MECRNCPYGEEDFKRRMWWYEKAVQEQGIPNDIYKYLTSEDAPDEFEQFLWCDKVGGKVYWAYKCTDTYDNNSDITKQINHSKQKRRNKRERDQKIKITLNFLLSIRLVIHHLQYIEMKYLFVGKVM